jgi:hypothetical protein
MSLCSPFVIIYVNMLQYVYMLTCIPYTNISSTKAAQCFYVILVLYLLRTIGMCRKATKYFYYAL